MPKYGEEHPNWKGGRYIDSAGYVQVRVAPNTYVREHRLVMEGLLGRPLLPAESVHHRNGDKTDNRPENLELLSNSEHVRQHWQENPAGFHHIERPQSQCHPERPHYGGGQCRPCYMSEAQKRHTAKHPEAVAERRRRWKQENQEKVAEQKRRARARKRGELV
jgi:hypothetical protein